MLVDGMALALDESRNHQLRQVGNGVVALCAATAFVVLARRAGIFMNLPTVAQGNPLSVDTASGLSNERGQMKENHECR
jgi:hypothetical protein